MLYMWEDTDGRFCDRCAELVESNLFHFHDTTAQVGPRRPRC